MVNIEQIDGVIKRERVVEDVFFCEPMELEAICFNIKNQLGYIWLKDIIAINRDEGVELRYLFYFLENNYKFTLVFNVPSQFIVKSIVHMWLNASYMEQEVNEMYGIKFSREYHNLIFDKANSVFPMLKNQKNKPKAKKISLSQIETLFHNSCTLAPLKFSTEWKGNVVEKSSLVSGLFHSGVEKIVEGKTLHQTLNILENFFTHRGSLFSLGFTRSIEHYNFLKIPDRAMAIRMISQEFIRILDHLYFLRDMHMQLKHSEGFMSFMLYIKTIHSLLISFSGNEYLHGINKVGGLLKDVDQVWMSRAMSELDQLEKYLQRDFQSIRVDGHIAQALDFPLLDKTLAYQKCISGPVARSVGLNLDLRKSNPDYFYSDVDFEVPIGSSGSAFDLYCVRFQEIFQSIRIIIQVLDNLPTGSISTAGDYDLRNQRTGNKTIDDSQYLKSFEDFRVPSDSNGSFFFEGPNGHLGLTNLIKNGEVERFKLFSNDFLLKNLFEQISAGKLLDELRLSWISLGIDIKTVER